MKLLTTRNGAVARAWFAALGVSACLLSVSAFAVDAPADERSAIAAQRAAAEAKFAARDKECRQRFVVSACVADARRDRRVALDALRVRQRVIDDARRLERSSERRAELAAKAAEDARRDAARATKVAPAASAASEPIGVGRQSEHRAEGRAVKAAAAASAASGGRAPKRVGGAKAPPAPRDPALRKTREERSREAFETRQREAARHRDEAITSAIQRMEKHQPGSPLPMPPASAP